MVVVESSTGIADNLRNSKTKNGPTGFIVSRFGGSCRVTLVLAFAFLLQLFGKWRNDTLSFYECKLSGGDTKSTC